MELLDAGFVFFMFNPFVPNARFLYSLYYIIDSDFICEIEIVLRVHFAFTWFSTPLYEISVTWSNTCSARFYLNLEVIAWTSSR